MGPTPQHHSDLALYRIILEHTTIKVPEFTYQYIYCIYALFHGIFYAMLARLNSCLCRKLRPLSYEFFLASEPFYQNYSSRGSGSSLQSTGEPVCGDLNSVLALVFSSLKFGLVGRQPVGCRLCLRATLQTGKYGFYVICILYLVTQ